MSFRPAGVGRMEITKYIHDNYENVSVNLICLPWANPYNTWSSIPVKFYLERDLNETKIQNLCDLSDTIIDRQKINLLAIRKVDLQNIECNSSLTKYNFMPIKQSIPEWIQIINKYYNGFDNKEVILLYEHEDFN